MTVEPATVMTIKPITPEEVLLNDAMSRATIAHSMAVAPASVHLATAARRTPWVNIGDALYALNHTVTPGTEAYVAPGSVMAEPRTVCPLDTLLNVGACNTAVNTGALNINEYVFQLTTRGF